MKCYSQYAVTLITVFGSPFQYACDTWHTADLMIPHPHLLPCLWKVMHWLTLEPLALLASKKPGRQADSANPAYPESPAGSCVACWWRWLGGADPRGWGPRPWPKASCDPALAWMPLACLLHAPKYQITACRNKGRVTVMHLLPVIPAALQGTVQDMQYKLLLSYYFVVHIHCHCVWYIHTAAELSLIMFHVNTKCFLMETTAMLQSCWDATVGMQLSQGVLQQARHKSSPHILSF